jgi:hypothetical protein
MGDMHTTTNDNILQQPLMVRANVDDAKIDTTKTSVNQAGSSWIKPFEFSQGHRHHPYCRSLKKQ